MKRLFVALVLGGVLAWFFLLRPVYLWGAISYIIVSGVSMEPTLHDGDLAVVRQGGNYSPGDIVAYRVPEGEPGEGAVIIHRIAGGTAEEGFVTQGDNKKGPDLWRPASDDVLGGMWFSIPGGGQVLLRLLQPVTLGLLAAGLGMVTVLLAPDPARQPKLSAPGRQRRCPAEDTDKA